MRLTHTVRPEEAGMTLQHVLRSVMGLSSRQARIAKQQGAVTVDGAPFFSNQKVAAGMVVCVELSYYAAETRAAEVPRATVRVLYEDEALLAVHKPALLQCHPSPSAPGGSDTLEARVTSHLGRPAHPVHRLDSETTGIVLFAKLPYAQAHLQQQMQDGTFRKTYQAWVLGRPDPCEGVIDAPIARENPDSFTRIVTPDGQRAVSRYRTLRSMTIEGGTELSLMELSPVTGRTHQLRVHMTHIGCPLLGDTRYHTAASDVVSRRLGLHYHQLAAVSLRFIHPVTGGEISVSYPAEFAFRPENLPLENTDKHEGA